MGNLPDPIDKTTKMFSSCEYGIMQISENEWALLDERAKD